MSPSDLINDLPRYSDWAPTGFDSAGLGLDDDDDTNRQAWRVLPIGQTRDSGVLARSNFRVTVKSLESADPDGNGHGARYRVSIFAARRDDMPDSGEIISYLAE